MIHDTDQQRHVVQACYCTSYNLQLSISTCHNWSQKVQHKVTSSQRSRPLMRSWIFFDQFYEQCEMKMFQYWASVARDLALSLTLGGVSSYDKQLLHRQNENEWLWRSRSIICAYRRHKPHQLSSNSYYLVILVVVVVIKMIEMSL